MKFCPVVNHQNADRTAKVFCVEGNPMQIADAAGAYTGMNSLLAANFTNGGTTTQQRNETDDKSNTGPDKAELTNSVPRVVQDRVEVRDVDGGRDQAADNQMKARLEAMRQAQLGRELEQMQLRARFRDKIKMDLGLTDDVLAQASMSQRFMYERQIEERLEDEVRRELVNRVIDERSAGESPVNTPDNLSAATATGVLSESDLPRLSIRA